MVVNGKLVNYDLSRFRNCKLRPAAICDLMRIPEFVAALENEKEFDVSDEWIDATVDIIHAQYQQQMSTLTSKRRRNQNAYWRRIMRNVKRQLKNNEHERISEE